MILFRFLVILLPWNTVVESQVQSKANNEQEDLLPRNEWYKMYSTYSTLCSTPDQLETRQIPPLLPPMNQAYTSQLIHVSLVIRHGARTPTSIHPCWKGYGDIGSDTAIWNCNLVTSLSGGIQQEQQSGNTDTSSTFTYQKKYDAFSFNTKTGIKNILNGTCQAAQLLQRGYDQVYTLGNLLRRTYLWEDEDERLTNSTSSRNTMIDTRLILFNLSEQSKEQWMVPNTMDGTITYPWDEPYTYFRSDDDQRTIMSGQGLFHGLFEKYHFSTQENNVTTTKTLLYPPYMTIHTADRSQDILAPNENTCPRLTILSQYAKDSREYKNNFINTKEVEVLQTFIQTELGVPTPSVNTFRDHALDCFITTLCTDRNLPPVLHYGESYNDTTYGSNLVGRLLNYTILPKTFIYRYNNSAYSKLSMIPLWKEIISHFPSTNTTTDSKQTKLALYSGHDTTLIPLLASLGERVWDGNQWIPYASMMNIEIHDISLNNNATVSEISTLKKKFPSLKAFRLIYNGVVLSEKIEGCTPASDLCDITFLMNQLLSFVNLDNSWSCALTNAEKETLSTLYHEFTKEVSRATSFFHTAGGKVILFLLLALSAFLSSLLTFTIITRKCPSWCCCCCRRRHNDREGESANLRSYESISFSSSCSRKNDNFVKPGWKDPRRTSDFRYVEVPSWFQDESHEIT